MRTDKPTVAVTGSAGQLGRAIVKRLMDEDYPVYAYDIAEDSKSITRYQKIDMSGILEDFIFPNEIETVLHLSGYRGLTVPIAAEMQNLIKANLESLSGALISAINVKHFIYVSSMSVYSENVSIPISESASTNPATLYGYSKWLGEKAVNIFKTTHPGIKISILRLVQVYGPGSPEQLSIYAMIDQALKFQSIEMGCSSDLIRDFIYLDDAAAALVAAVKKQPDGVYNISGHGYCRMDELADCIEDAVNFKLKRKFGSVNPGNKALDSKKFQSTVAFKPKVTLANGIKREVGRISVLEGIQ